MLIIITSMDPISATTPVGPVTVVDTDSAYAEANDSIDALLKNSKRQSAAMAAARSSAAAVVLPDDAESGVQVEDGPEDIETQIPLPERKTLKEDFVTSENSRILCLGGRQQSYFGTERSYVDGGQGNEGHDGTFDAGCRRQGQASGWETPSYDGTAGEVSLRYSGWQNVRLGRKDAKPMGGV